MAQRLFLSLHRKCSEGSASPRKHGLVAGAAPARTGLECPDAGTMLRRARGGTAHTWAVHLASRLAAPGLGSALRRSKSGPRQGLLGSPPTQDTAWSILLQDRVAMSPEVSSRGVSELDPLRTWKAIPGLTRATWARRHQQVGCQRRLKSHEVSRTRSGRTAITFADCESVRGWGGGAPAPVRFGGETALRSRPRGLMPGGRRAGANCTSAVREIAASSSLGFGHRLGQIGDL